MDQKQTIRKRRERLLQDVRLFERMVDSMPIGVIVSDEEGYIVYINETYARFWGIGASDEIGKYATDVINNSRLDIVAKTGVPEINYPHLKYLKNRRWNQVFRSQSVFSCVT